MAVTLPHPAVSPSLREKFVLVGVSVCPVCVCEWVMCGGQRSVMGVFLNPSLYFWGTQLLTESEVHQFV